MHKLIEYVCDELEELERKADKDGKLSMAEVQYADVLAHLKKDILTADAMWEESEYSEESGRGGMGGSSYARGGSSYRGSSYARGRRSNARRDSMGRYSSERGYSRAEDDMDSMIEELRGMMNELPEEKKHEVQRFIDKIERM